MEPRHEPITRKPPTGMVKVIERNIRALIERRQADDRRKGWQERLADAITRFSGSMSFVYIHLVLFGAWIVVNLFGPEWIRFDPTFVVLAMFASVEAIFLSTFVLITQNRMAALADKRADLDLQISLLSEHEVTRLIKLVTAMASRMGIEESHDPELKELAKDVRPERVLDEMERKERELTEGMAP